MAARLLPLFPLPLVLFPSVPLPLHVFEPRYRRMLSDCLEGDRVFGVLFRPLELDERELAPGCVGCEASVVNSEELPDGRSNIIVTGGSRFALSRFVDSDHPYHVGEVERYEDLPESESLAPIATRLKALFERAGRAARTLADDAKPLPALPDDPALLSFTVAALIDLDSPSRQRLLSSRSARARLAELEELLHGTLGNIEMRAALHIRARSNGHGRAATS
ncbi:MAG: LON peptidase substrate-binding domain-containing protein [Gemmatimonadaceae bacterium]